MSAPSAPVLKSDLAAPLTWLLFLSAALLAFLSRSIPLATPALEPRGALVYFVQAELFFLVLLWPLFLARKPGWDAFTWQLAVVAVLSAPLSFVAAQIAGAGFAAWAQSRLLVLTAASATAGFFSAPWSARWASTYYLAVLAVGLGLPYLAFLGGPEALAAVLSPFQAATRIAPDTWSNEVGVCAAIYGGAGITLLVASRIAARRTAPAG